MALLLRTCRCRIPIIIIVHTITSGWILLSMANGTLEQLRMRIRADILTTATNQDTEIDVQQVKGRIYLEESTGRTYAITKTETNIIINPVWYFGQSSIGDE
ncbi:hypothetical protein BDD12DRAFT_806249 [Trichophaea hybrida]|nr:hypothetical protein BDD12DRAFT_806249 [Trichophaea hybrida]